MRFSKVKLKEIYNLVNAEYLEQKKGSGSNGNFKGRKTEVSIVLVEKVYEAILGGKVLGWGVFTTELRLKHNLPCSQERVFSVVRAAEKVLDLVLISKFVPRGKAKKYTPPDLKWNKQINAIFGGVQC